jgi:hypothetical protein
MTGFRHLKGDIEPGWGEVMQQTTSRLLYNYWNSVRQNQPAPQRFDIEPMKIAPLLPETFILECGGTLGFRFRLAGTRICEQFGREMRGVDFLDMWEPQDRGEVETLFKAIVLESAIGALRFDGHTQDDRSVAFEMLALPLYHLGNSVSRILGSITAVDEPYWLGASRLTRFSVRAFDLDWPAPGGSEAATDPKLSIFSGRQSSLAGTAQRRLRVYEGGLAHAED